MSRQDDIRVAEILGWTDIRKEAMFRDIPKTDCGVDPSANRRRAVPHFTTDAGEDYKVLEWARSHPLSLTRDKWVLFRDSLEPAFEYQPGDYSRALLALKDKGLL